MKAGGFDAVIGNPPYLRVQGLQEHLGEQIEYFIKRYKSAVKRFDLYLLFIERGFELLSRNGLLSYICPHKFLNSDFGSGLRNYFIEKLAVKLYLSFGNNLIFSNASTYTGIILLQKEKDSNFSYYEFASTTIESLKEKLKSLEEKQFERYNLREFSSDPWILTLSSGRNVINRIQKQENRLGEVFDSIFQGVVTGIDEIYFLGRLSDEQGSSNIVEAFSNRERCNVKIERSILRAMLKGDDVSRYNKPEYRNYCIYPYKLIGNETIILEEDEFRKEYPLAYQYLRKYESEITELRIKFKTNPYYWYSCHRGRSIKQFENQRIITPEISLGCNMTLDKECLYHNTQVYSLLPKKDSKENVKYWLGLLNSKLLWFYISNTGNVLRGGYFRFKTNYLSNFPIRVVDFQYPNDIKLHNKMTDLVDQMLGFHSALKETKTPHDKEAIQRQIDAADRQIDNLVYELYGLTDEEIEIVEGSQKLK